MFLNVSMHRVLALLLFSLRYENVEPIKHSEILTPVSFLNTLHKNVDIFMVFLQAYVGK